MATARQWFARGLTAVAVAMPVVLVGLYALNPFGAQSYDPKQRIFGYAVYRIPSAAMLPTLKVGAFVFSRSGYYRDHAPARGDIVVFAPPQHPDQDWVKRVIGLPGDRVGYHGNRVFLDGKPLSYQRVGVDRLGNADADAALEWRETLDGRPHSVLEIENPPSGDPGEGDWTVPPGAYFLMGDNRDRSDDSRYWGTVPRSALKGKLVGVR